MSFVQSYTYDSLYRLTEAVEKTGTTTNWSQQFGYDRYGNRTSFAQDIGGIVKNTTPAVDANTNRFTSTDFGYDANGNIVEDIDEMTSLPREFIFNGDNKQTEVKRDGVTIGRYYYDGEGRRVKKITDTETTVFVYAAGQLIAEYSTAISQTPSVSYTTADHLGSPRVITNELGQVSSRRDFMPFGEELYAGVGPRTGDTGLRYSSSNDDVRQKFTGYQKDNETNLDFAEARMYQNLHGRFTAVDPLLASGKSANPQTFNRYVYVGNNPIMFTDPLGLDWLRTKERDEDGNYTYTDFNGKELKKMLKSGKWERVDFGDAESHYIESNGQIVYEMFAAGGGRAIDPNQETSAPASDDRTGNLLSSFAENYHSKSRTVRMGAAVAGVIGTCAGTAGAACAPAIRLGTAYLETEIEAARTGEPENTVAAPTTVGSYLHIFESGNFYAGKGTEARMRLTGRSLTRENNDPLVSSEFFPATSDRAAFANEHRIMMENGGPRKVNERKNTYNKIFSPGRKFFRF